MTTNDIESLRRILLRRENDSHKGQYGHLLLICGCRTMPGAAVLALGASLQSGCGLVTLHSTSRALQAAANSFPSGMLSEQVGDVFADVPGNLEKYSAIAVGPGLGKAEETASALSDLIMEARNKDIPMLIDADALNIISQRRELLGRLPEGSVMTPHLGELNRLGGDAAALSAESGCVVVKKGFHSRIFSPDGRVVENLTGNPGLAKGGSGDVLTGLVAGLMARGYDAFEAARLGVWIHGFAADRLSAERTMEAYSSRDLIDWLYKGFAELYSTLK